MALRRARRRDAGAAVRNAHARVERFFTTHHAWLAGILERGVQRGEFSLPAPATKTARLVLSALQGALLVKRTTGDMAQVKDVIAVLKMELTPPATRGSARRS